MGTFILNYVTNFLTYLSMAVTASFFENRESQKSKKIFLTLLIAFFSLISFLINDVGNFFVLFLFLIAINIIFTTSNPCNRFLQIIFSFLTVELLYDMGLLFCIIMERSFGLTTTNNIKNFFAITSVFINVFIDKIILRKCHLGNFTKGKLKYFFFYSILLIADFIISHGFFEYILAQNETQSFFIIDIAYVIISVGFYIELILIIYFMVMSDVHKANEQMANMYLNMQENYYDYLEKREEDTRKFRHDIRNHLTMIRLLYQEHNYTEIEKYLDELDIKITQLSRHIDVGNEIANALLNYYEDCMQKKSITLKVEGRIPKSINISTYDFCTILSNLLDNSLKAPLPDKDLEVKISFSFDANHYMISCSNPLKESAKKTNFFQTTKNDKKNHGFGLKNIEETILKYHGIMDISAEKEMFRIDLIIPRNEALHENSNC